MRVVAKMKQRVLNLSDLRKNSTQDHDPVEELHGQHVQVNGFWHSSPHNSGVLTTSPDLKSCCAQAPTKIYQQLIIKGELPTLDRSGTVSLEGTFKIDPQHNQKGDLIQYYVLEEAKEVPTEGSDMLIGVIGLATAWMVWGLSKWSRYKRG
jgi:hypothetical protein